MFGYQCGRTFITFHVCYCDGHENVNNKFVYKTNRKDITKLTYLHELSLQDIRRVYLSHFDCCESISENEI